jgi:hypothetical protein
MHHVDTVRLRARLLFPGVVADTSAMERIFRDSELDWTMVRPPQLTDKPYTGRYRVREGRLPRFGFKISRAGQVWLGRGFPVVAPRFRAMFSASGRWRAYLGPLSL